MTNRPSMRSVSTVRSLLRRISMFTLAAAGLLFTPAAYAAAGDPSVVAGSWSGPSLDVTYNIAGNLTAIFEAAQAKFTGTIHAVYPDYNFSETCTVDAGLVSSTGAVMMHVLCRPDSRPDYIAPAVIEAQLSSDNTVMTGTFRGPSGDAGTFTLRR